MSKPSLVVVIVEDDRHQMLTCRYLSKRGLKSHAIRVERAPSGQGSAENWVRKAFAKETVAYRRRHAKTALIILVDADNHTVQQRLDQLNGALREIGESPIDPRAERIARLIPRRNIETWILCLNGEQVDEETDYKARVRGNELIPPAAETLSIWVHSAAEPPGLCVDSLRRGVQDLKNLGL